MLTGAADLATLVLQPPTIASFDIEPVTLTGVELIQVQYELAAESIEQLLPPALHPTIPPLGQWLTWEVPDSPWGAFTLVQFRISSRSGSRPRAFTLCAFINIEKARAALCEL